MKQYTVTMDFDVLADSPEDARRKVQAHLFRNDPQPPFPLPPAPNALGAELDEDSEPAPELPWAPKGPGCTALT